MLYLSLTLAVVPAVVAVAFAQVIRSLVRQQARERDLLVNQMCSLAGRPWQPAPSHVVHDRPEPDLSFVSPEQWPEDDL